MFSKVQPQHFSNMSPEAFPMAMSTKALLLQRSSERGSSLSQVTQFTGQGAWPVCLCVVL